MSRFFLYVRHFWLDILAYSVVCISVTQCVVNTKRTKTLVLYVNYWMWSENADFWISDYFCLRLWVMRLLAYEIRVHYLGHHCKLTLSAIVLIQIKLKSLSTENFSSFLMFIEFWFYISDLWHFNVKRGIFQSIELCHRRTMRVCRWFSFRHIYFCNTSLFVFLLFHNSVVAQRLNIVCR